MSSVIVCKTRLESQEVSKREEEKDEVENEEEIGCN